jgi:hypothetical protein
MLGWVASHANRLRRPGYEPPNHLANGTVRFFGAGIGATFDLKLDANGRAPELILDPAPKRIEIYGGSGELLYTEEA